MRQGCPPHLRGYSMKRLLFVCRDNANRSQMAEAFARLFGSEDIEAYSAGMAPVQALDPRCIPMMQEVGCDLARQHTKSLQSLADTRFDVVVLIDESEAASQEGLALTGHWRIADPADLPDARYREIRHDIGSRVRGLLNALEAGTSTDQDPGDRTDEA